MKWVSLATNDIGTKITVLDILMRTKTFDNRSIGEKNTNIVKHSRLFDKSRIDIETVSTDDR